MENSCTLHVQIHGNPWKLHGKFMENSWKFMENSWKRIQGKLMETNGFVFKPPQILWEEDIVLPVTPLRIVPRSAAEHELGSDSWLHRMPRRVQPSTPNILKALVSDSSRNAALGNGISMVSKLPMRPPECRTRNSSDKSQSLRSNRLSSRWWKSKRITIGSLGSSDVAVDNSWKNHGRAIYSWLANHVKSMEAIFFVIYRNSYGMHRNSKKFLCKLIQLLDFLSLIHIWRCRRRG